MPQPRIVERIPGMSDPELLQLWKNAVRSILTNPDATTVLDAIDVEVRLRRERVEIGNLTPQTPSEGMLHELGYKVGNNGERKPVRRAILTQIIERQLPPVGSHLYVMEWGEPNSRERYLKLTRVLDKLVTNPAHRLNHQALMDWGGDLEWIQQTFLHLAQ
jgi:hypothetical protein